MQSHLGDLPNTSLLNKSLIEDEHLEVQQNESNLSPLFHAQ